MSATKGSGSLRIIAGTWRGRKLPVASLPGLRPSGDRIRETLFNWLDPDIAGARCLDLFAGTGALGLEALSRGAAHCHFVEQNAVAAGLLQKAFSTLNADDHSTLIHGDALAFLQGALSSTAAGNAGSNEHSQGLFDVVFLDPPFASTLMEQSLELLANSTVLAPGAIIYLEYPSGQSPQIPGAWQAYRSKQTGKKSNALIYELYRLQSS